MPCLAGRASAPADLPTTPDARAKLVGQPAALIVQPEQIALKGPHATQQIVITGRYADGNLRDLTHVAEVAIESSDVALLDADRFLWARKNGVTNLVVKAGKHTIKVPIIVADADRPQPVSFRNEVIAALNVGGCNAGACHGTPTGKNGFKLSLRGYDPASDYIQLTRDVLGRRTDRQNPLMSLMLQKGLGRVPHEGGTRFAADQHPRADDPRLARARASPTTRRSCRRQEGRSAARATACSTPRPAISSWPCSPTSPTAPSAMSPA